VPIGLPPPQVRRYRGRLPTSLPERAKQSRGFPTVRAHSSIASVAVGSVTTSKTTWRQCSIPDHFRTNRIDICKSDCEHLRNRAL
jgi:hypothetical protein